MCRYGGGAGGQCCLRLCADSGGLWPGAAISFAGEQAARGQCLINDVVIPTADPRIPFGGRGRSGFGVTRGAEGAAGDDYTATLFRCSAAARSAPMNQLPMGISSCLRGLAQLLHAGGIRARWSGLKGLLRAGEKIEVRNGRWHDAHCGHRIGTGRPCSGGNTGGAGIELRSSRRILGWAGRLRSCRRTASASTWDRRS
jgi:hypothetical protein